MIPRAERCGLGKEASSYFKATSFNHDSLLNLPE
jgi:hypothetical protein